MFNLELFKKIIESDGVCTASLKLIKNLIKNEEDILLVNRIYNSDLLSEEINKKYLFQICKMNGVDNVYIGKRVRNYSINTVEVDSSEELCNEKNGFISFFRHKGNDFYYYDLFDGNECTKILNDSVYLEDGCYIYGSVASILNIERESDLNDSKTKGL